MIDLHRLRVASLLALFASVVSTQALAREWSATGLYEQIVVSDCRNCGEDIGILFACTGNGQPAEITVNAAASERGRDGEIAPVTFTIDGQSFTYQARTVEFGLIGFTPVFSIAYDDPLTAALQAGRNAIVSFNGQQSVIGLKGSRSALSIFKAHCGWTVQGFEQNLDRQREANAGQAQPQQNEPQEGFQMPSYSHTVETRTDVKPGTVGMFWYTGDGMGGGSPKTLSYAVPESDERSFFASCEKDGDFMTVEIYSDFGNSEAGELINLEINHPGGQEIYQGHTFIDNEEYAGSRFEITRDRNLWLSMANAPNLTFGNEGFRQVSVSSVEGKEAFFEFAQACGR